MPEQVRHGSLLFVKNLSRIFTIPGGCHDVTGTSSSVAVLNVYGDSGTFLSPGYPKQYSNNLNLTYTAHLDSSGPLMVRLSMELDLQGKTGFCYDYVRLFSLLYCGAGSLVTEGRACGTSQECQYKCLRLLFIFGNILFINCHSVCVRKEKVSTKQGFLHMH